jgi:hypothetical protein
MHIGIELIISLRTQLALHTVCPCRDRRVRSNRALYRDDGRAGGGESDFPPESKPLVGGGSMGVGAVGRKRIVGGRWQELTTDIRDLLHIDILEMTEHALPVTPVDCVRRSCCLLFQHPPRLPPADRPHPRSPPSQPLLRS